MAMAASSIPTPMSPGAMERMLQRWREATAPLDTRAMGAGSALSILSTESASAPDDRDEAPHRDTCRAWSFADFTDRVASFSIATWFAKPEALSPLVCARFGWRQSASPEAVGLLECSHCEQLLCLDVAPSLSADGVEAVTKRFVGLLETAHEDTCPWRGNASPESFTALPIRSKEQVLQVLETSVASLLVSAKQMPRLAAQLRALTIHDDSLTQFVQEASPENLATTSATMSTATVASTSSSSDREAATRVLDALLARWPASFPSVSDDDTSRVLFNAVVLSSSGWAFREVQYEENEDITSEPPTLSCSFCNRRIGLEPSRRDAEVDADVKVEAEADGDGDSNTEAKADVEGEAVADASPPRKRQRMSADANRNGKGEGKGDDGEVDDSLTLDPFAQHRWFCPWVSSARIGATDRDTDADMFPRLPGWKQHAQALGMLQTHTIDRSAARTPSSNMAATQAFTSVRAILSLADSPWYT